MKSVVADEQDTGTSTWTQFWRQHVRHLSHMPSAEEQLHVVVSRSAFKVIWTAVALLQAIMFVALLWAMVQFLFLSSPTSESTRTTFELGSTTHLRSVALAAALGAVAYAWNLVRMLHASWRKGHATFPTTPLFRVDDDATISSPRGLRGYARLAFASLYSRRGLLGVDHPSFDTIFALRELVEVASQSYQAYAASVTQPRRSVSEFMCALLVLNCWSSIAFAFAPRLLRRSTSAATPRLTSTETAQRRLWVLIVDALIDTAWTLGVPFMIALPYSVAYDPAVRGFPRRLMGDHAWLLLWRMETHFACITSSADLLATVLPAFSILVASRGISAIVRMENDSGPDGRGLSNAKGKIRTPDGPAGAKTTALTRLFSSFARFSSAVVPRADSVHTPKRSSADHEAASSRTPGRWFHAMSHGLFAAWGFVIVMLHGLSRHQSFGDAAAVGCKVWTHPWGLALAQCAYAELNCAQMRSAFGAASVSDHDLLATALVALDSQYLLQLVVAHCSALEMPATIAQFHELRLLEVYNSTIVAWSEAAAVTLESHPKLKRVGLIRVQALTVPVGLLQRCPADTMSLVATNLTTLPDAVRDAWPRLKYLTFEHGDLTELPPVLTTLPALQRLALTDNQLRELPTTVAAALRILMLQRNPLRAVPELADWTQLQHLGLDDTQIERMPAWLVENAAALRAQGLVAFAHATPFCAARGGSDSGDADALAVVQCTRADPQRDGFYPLSAVDAVLAQPGWG